MLDAKGSGKPSPHPENSTLAAGALGFVSALNAEANGSLTVVAGLLIAAKGSIEGGIVKGSAGVVGLRATGSVLPIPEKMSVLVWGLGYSTSFMKPNSSLTWGVSEMEIDSSGRVASL